MKNIFKSLTTKVLAPVAIVGSLMGCGENIEIFEEDITNDGREDFSFYNEGRHVKTFIQNPDGSYEAAYQDIVDGFPFYITKDSVYSPWGSMHKENYLWK